MGRNSKEQSWNHLLYSWTGRLGFLMPTDHLALSGSRSYFSFLMDGLKALRDADFRNPFCLEVSYLGVSFRNRHMWWGQGANSEILIGSQRKRSLEKTAVIFITKFLAEVSWLQVSHVIVWQYQKQHIHSWPGVPSSSWGTGSGSCQCVCLAEIKRWPRDVTLSA